MREIHCFVESILQRSKNHDLSMRHEEMSHFKSFKWKVAYVWRKSSDDFRAFFAEMYFYCVINIYRKNYYLMMWCGHCTFFGNLIISCIIITPSKHLRIKQIGRKEERRKKRRKMKYKSKLILKRIKLILYIEYLSDFKYLTNFTINNVSWKLGDVWYFVFWYHLRI